jgi:FixJ family two-component response regulator
MNSVGHSGVTAHVGALDLSQVLLIHRPITLAHTGIQASSTLHVPRYTKFVLLVDDDPSDLFLFKRLLEESDFQVMATCNPETAMSMIVAGEVGCLITDQIMPVSGQELVAHMRSARADIGVILLSGAEFPRQAVPPGMTFISKDDKQQLVETVTACMSKFRAA